MLEDDDIPVLKLAHDVSPCRCKAEPCLEFRKCHACDCIYLECEFTGMFYSAKNPFPKIKNRTCIGCGIPIGSANEPCTPRDIALTGLRKGDFV